MPETLSSPALFLMLLAASASLAALLVLFERHISGKQLLAMEPRVRVPWGPGVVAAVMLIVFSGLILNLTREPAEPAGGPAEDTVSEEVLADELPADESSQPAAENEATPLGEAAAQENAETPATSPLHFILNSLATGGFLLLLVAAIGAWLHQAYGASAVDLGLPLDREQAQHDILRGVVGWRRRCCRFTCCN